MSYCMFLIDLSRKWILARFKKNLKQIFEHSINKIRIQEKKPILNININISSIFLRKFFQTFFLLVLPV